MKTTSFNARDAHVPEFPYSNVVARITSPGFVRHTHYRPFDTSRWLYWELGKMGCWIVLVPDYKPHVFAGNFVAGLSAETSP